MTGTPETLHETALSLTWTWVRGIVMRGEFRRDTSSARSFESHAAGYVHNQSTTLIGLIATVGAPVQR